MRNLSQQFPNTEKCVSHSNRLGISIAHTMKADHCKTRTVNSQNVESVKCVQHGRIITYQPLPKFLGNQKQTTQWALEIKCKNVFEYNFEHTCGTKAFFVILR
jgi:hypothetical protein